ncbi:MAG: hypothetical protein ABI629_08120 [bacterium]
MTYFTTTTPSGRISAARIHDAAKRLALRAHAQRMSAGRQLARLIRLLGIKPDDRLTVWMIAQHASRNALQARS